MKRKLALALAAVVIAASAAFGGTLPASAEVDPYVTEGTHRVNGRDWRTTCEPYSQTTRCRTEIKATTVTQVKGRFVQKTGWYFNNLTYLPSARSLWKNNPLSFTNKFTAADGRKWRTECETPATGRNGCRSYAEAKVIAGTQRNGVWTYKWVTKSVFNNIVQFTVPTPPVEAVVTMPDANLRGCINQGLNRPRAADITLTAARNVGGLHCSFSSIGNLRGLEHFSNLTELRLFGNDISDLAPLSRLDLESLDIGSNAIVDLSPLASVTSLTDLRLRNNRISNLAPLRSMKTLDYLVLSRTEVKDLTPLKDLKNLSFLDLEDTLVTDLGPVSGLKELTRLYIESNGIRDISPLSSLSNLEILYAGDNQISDLAPLKGRTKLWFLDLHSNTITDISALASLTKLEVLYLSDNTIEDVAPIAGLGKVWDLWLDSNQIVKVAPLAGLPEVETLMLWDNPIVDRASLDPLIARGVEVLFEDPDA